MSELEERIKIIEEQWKEVYEQCSANPTLYKSYLTEITIDDVGSVVLIVLEWLKNSKDNAIGKTYALSKQVMITSLKNTLADLNKLYTKQYNFFGSFTTNLNQLLISLFPLTFLNRKSVIPAEIQLRNSENIATLKDLSEKISNEETQYKSILEYGKEINSQKSEIKEIFTSSKSELEKLNKTKEKIEEELSAISETISTIKSSRKEMEGFKEEAKELLDDNKTVHKQLEKSTSECEELKKRVSDLLPGATSAGLASSFAEKVKTLSKSKLYWTVGFVVSIMMLIVSVIYSIKTQTSTGNIWIDLISRFPIIFPGIWLAWFCARAQGHAARLEEKYAFKEAMSKAFEGYKNQMQDIDTINKESMAQALSALIISILSENPSNVFERACSDETPFHGAMKPFVDKALNFRKKE
ncbi:MAG: hypothetical protein LE178_03545 [Endomicrobium sp.]|nr:hypothetical protein [Endomicrobium sp.]